MRLSFLFTLTVLFLFSCTSKEERVIVVFDKGNSLQQGNPIMLNNVKVGQVEKISLNNKFMFCASLILEKGLKIPDDSEFTYTNYSLFEAGILIKPGHSKKYLIPGDSIHGRMENEIPLDSILTFIKENIDNSKPVRNQDSIIAALRDLNGELKKLNGK